MLFRSRRRAPPPTPPPAACPRRTAGHAPPRMDAHTASPNGADGAPTGRAEGRKHDDRGGRSGYRRNAQPTGGPRRPARSPRQAGQQDHLEAQAGRVEAQQHLRADGAGGPVHLHRAGWGRGPQGQEVGGGWPGHPLLLLQGALTCTLGAGLPLGTGHQRPPMPRAMNHTVGREPAPRHARQGRPTADAASTPSRHLRERSPDSREHGAHALPPPTGRGGRSFTPG